MKKIHIFAPRRHSEERVCSSKKMASHSSVTSLCEAVQGRHYGLIDSLVITRLLSDANQVSNGNQLMSIEDYAEKHLTYTGASDFYDGL